MLLCLVLGANTVSLGAFPALLPELGVATGLADWQLGAVAGAFGFARMIADVPVGLFVTHHLARALQAAPLFLLAGALLLAAGDGFTTLLVGRALVGTGHTLATLAGLTAILRYRAGPRLASALAALELSAMLGVLVGAASMSVLPRAVSWNVAFVVASVPTAMALALLPRLLRSLPPADPARSLPLFARNDARASTSPHAPAPPGAASLGLLAGVAGAVIAVSYATMEQFLVPIRGSREFGLERPGIARLLMLSQVVDIVALLPLGALADRRGAPPVLGAVLLVIALALGLIGFGSLPLVMAGCASFGLGMAGWTLPVGVLRSVTPPAQVAWRAALYRVAVDGGMCLGPLVAGVLATRHGRLLPALLITVLATVGAALLTRRSPVPAADPA